VIEAKGLSSQGGRIVLGADAISNTGTLNVSSGTGQGGIWHLALIGWLTKMGLKADHVAWVPSNGAAPKRVAFVQCAGSRDVKHLPYCSAVCCMASTKQAMYVKEQLPEAEVTVYYIDRRTPGRNEAMLAKAEAKGVKFVKGKVGTVAAGKDSALVLHLEDVDAGRLTDAEADLVVLATGMVPGGAGALPFPVTKDPDGFTLDEPVQKVFAAGVARRPEDVAASVRDATGAAAKALCAARSV